jgi:hypothetical protein
LSAFDEPFNDSSKCRSYANKGVFGIKKNEVGINELTNRKDGCFTIEELEVYQVKEVDL